MLARVELWVSCYWCTELNIISFAIIYIKPDSEWLVDVQIRIIWVSWAGWIRIIFVGHCDNQHCWFYTGTACSLCDSWMTRVQSYAGSGIKRDSCWKCSSTDGRSACVIHTTVEQHFPTSCHITPILRSLHWLKINECMEYKLLSLTYKVLTITQPPYLHNLMSS